MGQDFCIPSVNWVGISLTWLDPFHKNKASVISSKMQQTRILLTERFYCGNNFNFVWIFQRLKSRKMFQLKRHLAERNKKKNPNLLQTKSITFQYNTNHIYIQPRDFYSISIVLGIVNKLFVPVSRENTNFFSSSFLRLLL